MRIEPPTNVSFRLANGADAPLVAELYGTVRRAAVPAIPPAVHTPAEDMEFFGHVIESEAEVWVATCPEQGDRLVAFSIIQDDWLHSLYVHPDVTGQGIGSVLLDYAKVARPGGFGLWVFESNVRARAFYERRGLVAVRRTDGSANQEQAPDVEMLWPGADPVTTLRDAIDQVDQELARLLELRAGLTAEVQAYKAGGGCGPAPRDPGREAEIVARMSPAAPRLGVRRLSRIMHTVIAESLDAVPRPPAVD